MSHGGGHAPGVGRRGATEFPLDWSRDRITDVIVDVARYPDETPVRLPDGTWRTVGVRDGVRVVALLDPDGPVRAAYPVDGPGVGHNPDRSGSPDRPTVDDLADGRVSHAATELLARLDGRLDPQLVGIGRELYDVGEWDELGRLIRSAASDLSPEEADLLADLT